MQTLDANCHGSISAGDAGHRIRCHAQCGQHRAEFQVRHATVKHRGKQIMRVAVVKIPGPVFVPVVRLIYREKLTR
jgi:hypothetical protein